MGRPIPRFQEFVGQRRIVAILQPQLEGAKARGEPFPPALLCGPSGIGKSLLAQACAQAYGTTLCSVDGHEPVARIVQRFKTLKANDFVFIDEAHNLANGAQELLYSCIDHRRIPPWALPANDIKDLQLSTEGFPIAPFSLLLATDQPGQLLGALRRRLELTLSLEYYSSKEMRAIVDHQATGAELLLSPQARNKVARVACGLPRRAKHLLQNLRRHFPDAEQRQLTLDDIRAFLRTMGIDRHGLTPQDRKYVRYLDSVERASQESLALHLGCDAEYVRQEIEGTLQQMGLVVIASGGRALTAKGKEITTKLLTKEKIHHGNAQGR